MGDTLPFEPETPLCVDIVATFEVPRSWSQKRKNAVLMPFPAFYTKKPDLDNIAKLMDALNGIVWADDSQVVILHITKAYGEIPGIHFNIQPI